MGQHIRDRRRVRRSGRLEAQDVPAFTHGLGTDQSVWDRVAR